MKIPPTMKKYPTKRSQQKAARVVERWRSWEHRVETRSDAMLCLMIAEMLDGKRCLVLAMEEGRGDPEAAARQPHDQHDRHDHD